MNNKETYGLSGSPSLERPRNLSNGLAIVAVGLAVAVAVDEKIQRLIGYGDGYGYGYGYVNEHHAKNGLFRMGSSLGQLPVVPSLIRAAELRLFS